MANFGTLAAGALVLTTAMGAAEQADAQATEVMLPHPDGQISVDVSRVAYETQAEIMAELGECLKGEFEASDENENGELDTADEQEFFEEGQAFCAESAALDFSIATNETRIADAKARVDALGDVIIQDLQNGS